MSRKTLTYKEDDEVPDYYIIADDNTVVKDALEAASEVAFDDEESQFLLDHIPEDTDPSTRKALERQLKEQRDTFRREADRLTRRYSSSSEEVIKERRSKRKHKLSDSDSDVDLRRRPKPEDVKPERKPSPPRRRSSEEEVIYRDREGRKISRGEWLELREQSKRKKRPETHKVSEADLEWGGGLKQKRDEQARMEYERELAKGPIARHDIDADLDRELREKQRWEDPMSKRRKRSSSPPKSRFPAPPNRFGIVPGSRWDGRIRGNGFEQRYLAAYSAHKSSSKNYQSAMD